PTKAKKAAPGVQTSLQTLDVRPHFSDCPDETAPPAGALTCHDPPDPLPNSPSVMRGSPDLQDHCCHTPRRSARATHSLWITPLPPVDRLTNPLRGHLQRVRQ